MVFVMYDGEDLWHERLLLAPVGSSSTQWIIRTPDDAQYLEDFTHSNEDIMGLRLPSAPGQGPAGVGPNSNVYRFRVAPDGAQKQQWIH